METQRQRYGDTEIAIRRDIDAETQRQRYGDRHHAETQRQR